MKTLYRFLTLKEVGTIASSLLQFTTNGHLAKFLSTFPSSSHSYINTTCWLPSTQSTERCSNFELYHQEIDKKKTILENNGYPKSFVDFCIKTLSDKVFIKKTASKKELFCDLTFIGKMFKKKIRHDIVYRYKWSNYKVTYHGKTYSHFFARTAEYMNISNITGKCLKTVKQSAVSDHLLECNSSIDFDHVVSLII